MEAVITSGEELLAVLPSPAIVPLDKDDLELPPSPPPSLIPESIVDVVLTSAFRLGVQSAMLKEDYGQMLLRMMTIYATEDVSSLPQRGTIYNRWKGATHDALTAAKMQAIVDTTDKMLQLEADLAEVTRLQILLQDLCNGPIVADIDIANINPHRLAQQLQAYASQPVKFAFVEPDNESKPHYLQLRDIPAIRELAAYSGVSLSELDTQEKLDGLLEALFGESSEPRIVELTGVYPTLFALGTVGAAAFLIYTMLQLVYNKDAYWRSRLSAQGMGALMLVTLAMSNYLFANYEDVREQIRNVDVFNATIVGRPGVNILLPEFDLPSTTQRENLETLVETLLNVLPNPQEGFAALMASMPVLLRHEQQLMYATLRSTFTRPITAQEQAREEGYLSRAGQELEAFGAYIRRQWVWTFGDPEVYKALYVDIPFVRDVSVEISNLWIFDQVRVWFARVSAYDAFISFIISGMSGVAAPLGSSLVLAGQTTNTITSYVSKWTTWLFGWTEEGNAAAIIFATLYITVQTASLFASVSRHVHQARDFIRAFVSQINLSPWQILLKISDL